MLASTFMDMVLGVDIHFEMVPMPAPVPTPLPNPFVGMVFDPGSLLTGAAMSLVSALLSGKAPLGPVIINCQPATTVGMNAKNSMGVPHILIPPGTAWAPMPKLPKPSFKGPPPPPGPPVAPEGDGIVVFGSPTVNFMGTSASRMGDKVMSCGEPVRLPSSTILAIPKGMPVMVGGPPAISISDAIGALLKSKWVAGYLHDLASNIKSDRIRGLVSKAICFVTGHPVDVATGRVLTDHVDWELPGSFPLKFERSYSSARANRWSPLGHGWAHSLDQAVWPERGCVVHLDGEGREIQFDTFDEPDHVIRPGKTLWDPISRLTLKALGDRRYEVTSIDGVTSEFGPVPGATGARKWWSRLLRRVTRDGRAIELSYDQAGNLAWVTDAAGRQVGFDHDRRGRLVTVKLPHPQQQGWVVHTRYAYDDADDLVAVTDPLGHAWRFVYNQHLLVQETNRNGLSFYFAYDGHGQDAYCTRTWGDGGIYDHLISYDKVGKVTCVTNSLGHTTTYKMNIVGCVTEVIDALGGATKYEYDERTLWKVKETNAVGGETKWEHDARGNVVKTTGPDGAVVSVEYNDRNRPIRAIDPVGGEWQWGYDDRGRVVGRIDSMNRRVQFHWRELGRGPKQLVALTDPKGQQTTLGYDDQGNLTSLRTPDGAESGWHYDAVGRCTEVIDVRGNAQHREYDALGRVLRVRERDGNTRDLTYDPEGNVVHARDAQADVRFTYKGLGRVATRKQAGTTVGFSYDTEERLVGITNEHGCVYRFDLGPTGQVDVEHGFDGVRRQYERDKVGRVTKVFRPASRETAYRYDDAGRVVEVKYDSGEAEAYTYRPDGELMQAKNQAAEVVLERDLLGRVVREVVGDDWVASDYDALGMRVRIQSSRGLDEKITRDAMGRTIGVEASVKSNADNPSETWTARITRDVNGLETDRQLPGGVRTRWGRDVIGRPIKQEVWSGADFRRAVQYTWEANNRLRSVIDALRGPTRLEHDAFGNLAAAVYADGVVDLRLPDAVGNLFRSATQSDRRYGPDGRLLQVSTTDGSVDYIYDREGNLVQKIERSPSSEVPNVWNYEWSGAGLLAKVVRPDGQQIAFNYDAMARRLLKKTGTTVLRWLWHHDTPIHEWYSDTTTELETLDPTGSVSWLFEPETLVPMTKFEGHKPLSILTDHVGAPHSAYDSQGKLAWSAELDVQGALRLNQGERSQIPFRWLGQYDDPDVGLYYNRFRYYDPGSGRYISQDPTGLAGGLRFYGYPSDPTVAADPFGLEGCRVHTVAPDFETKGVHLTAPNGIELSVVPTHDGGVKFKAVFSGDAEADVAKAIKQAETELAENQTFKAKLADTAERATSYLVGQGNPGKSAETHFVAVALSR